MKISKFACQILQCQLGVTTYFSIIDIAHEFVEWDSLYIVKIFNIPLCSSSSLVKVVVDLLTLFNYLPEIVSIFCDVRQSNTQFNICKRCVSLFLNGRIFRVEKKADDISIFVRHGKKNCQTSSNYLISVNWTYVYGGPRIIFFFGDWINDT